MPRGTAHSVSPERVKWLLLSPNINDHEAAKELGVKWQTVQQIRTGKIYVNQFPEIPRRGTGSCYLCQNMLKRFEHDEADGRSKPTASYRCGFGFPDFEELGPSAARDCQLYTKSKPSSHSTTSSSRSTRQKG